MGLYSRGLSFIFLKKGDSKFFSITVREDSKDNFSVKIKDGDKSSESNIDMLGLLQIIKGNSELAFVNKYLTNEQRYIFSNLVSGFDGTTITDVGCGRADLYDHLNVTTGVISYNGIDHNPSMTQLAKQRYNIDCITDAFENSEIPEAKWIVACSLFTQRRCETEDADLVKLFEDIDKMYTAADSVVAFNLLSPINNNIVEGFFYAHPGLILDMLIEKYKNVSIRHNYSEFLYTVTIYKF